MTTYFTSDTHFSHAKIIEYSYRPYLSVHEMDTDLINKWNSIITSEDIVYHLGDFCFGPRDNTKIIREKLNGYVILISGNHDRSHKTMLELGINEVYSELFVESKYGKLLLTHKPKEDSSGKNWSSFNLHGHVHNSWKFKYKHINVGVDVNEFFPKTVDELIEEYKIWEKENSSKLDELRYRYEFKRED